MVDINLIGDDKTGEEERVEDFTQTSSMDTQELAFEERTETFDTTKTSGLSRRRSYSSLMSTLIIVAVIIVMALAAYYFIFSGGKTTTQQADIPPFTNESQDLADSNPGENITADNEEPFTFDEEPMANADNAQANSDLKTQPENIQPAQPKRQPADVITTPRVPASSNRENVNNVSSQFLSTTRSTVNSVASLMQEVPASLNTTLLSLSGQRVHIEVLGKSSDQVHGFADQLNQSFGSGVFSVVSEDRIAADGGQLNRILISGKMSPSGSASTGEQVEFLSLSQVQDWVKNACLQYGLELQQLKSQQASFVQGYQKTPIFARIYGAQSSVIGFLQEISSQNINVELTKVQLISPDMVSFSDENLVLVIYMYLYQQS